MTVSPLAAARAHDALARLPLCIGACVVGSVARVHLPALAAWPQWLQLAHDAVTLTATDRNTALAQMNSTLRAAGLIRAWRDETFPLFEPDTRHTLALMERAATRFWGTLTLGAHLNGFIADSEGRPAQLWIAQRSFRKATDPGAFDNLVGGGVAAGQSPQQALVREAWEEAGLEPGMMQALQPGRVLRLHRDIAEGLQFEDLHTWDLELPPAWTPHNTDGEVRGFQLMPLAQALALAESCSMTVDAALVTLDFGLRHGLLASADAGRISTALFGLAV